MKRSAVVFYLYPTTRQPLTDAVIASVRGCLVVGVIREAKAGSLLFDRVHDA